MQILISFAFLRKLEYHYPMRNSHYLIVLVYSLLFVTNVFAAGDITTPNFTIPLDTIDPLAGSRGGWGAYWVDSIFFLLEWFSRLLLFMIPVIAIISVLIAGYFYIFSAGDSEKAGRAKTIIKWNILAIGIALMSWSIIKIIASFFST